LSHQVPAENTPFGAYPACRQHFDIIKWWVDAAFAVLKDMHSHTGGVMSMGAGAAYSSSQKQKMNTKSSTETELVGANDVLPQILSTQYFLKAQGYGTNNMLYQDNQSTMKLEQNGKASSGNRTRHINIRYFFITNCIARKEVEIKYCPTQQVVADNFTKPLQGALLYKFRIGPHGVYPWRPKECVGIQSSNPQIRNFPGKQRGC
jgi:hypothetical protein